MVPGEQTSDPQGSDLVYGWLNPASAEKDARNNDDVIVVSGMTGEPPSVRASYALGALEVAIVSGGPVEVEPWETSRQWQGVVVGYLVSAHELSPRAVRRVFAANGVTVSSLVRERRLERIRDELVDPAHARESIGTIAARWGFPDPATLSSAFTRRYGSSPRRYRADLQRQGQPGAAD